MGTAIALDTIEHVERFWVVGEELHRILRPGGIALLTSVMYFPVHEHPADYWRFTPDGFRTLARPFETVLVEWAGLREFPHTVVALAIKEPVDPAAVEQLQSALREWRRRDGQGVKEFLALILPPVLLVPGYRWFNRLASWRAREES